MKMCAKFLQVNFSNIYVVVLILFEMNECLSSRRVYLVGLYVSLKRFDICACDLCCSRLKLYVMQRRMIMFLLVTNELI